LYNVKTYKVTKPVDIKFKKKKLADVYIDDDKLPEDKRYKKPLKIAKIGARLIAQNSKVFAELAKIDTMSNLDLKDAATNKLKNNFLAKFTDGTVEKDEQLKIDAYEKCIANVAAANLTLVSSIQESSFEPKLFVKKGVEEEKVS